MKGRSLPLDVLRALAVFLVLLHHAAPWHRALPFSPEVSEGMRRGGWIGVDLFFVLSGFLIAGLLFREHQRFGVIRYRRFVVRRGLKIYPAFYVFLAATIVGGYMRGGGLPRAIWFEALFVQNYFGGIWGHTWSLAIEEHFYLFLPALLVLLTRWKRTRPDPFAHLPAICLAIAAGVLALRVYNSFANDYGTRTHFYPTHLRMDSLMFGVLLAYLHHYRREAFESVCKRFFWPLMIAGVWFCVPAFLFRVGKTPFLYSLGFTQFYVGCGMIVSALFVRGIPSNRVTRAIAFIGSYSYSIYLWHTMVRWWGMEWFLEQFEGPVPLWIAFSVYVSTSLAAGILMATLVEMPVVRLRDRLFPSRSPAMDPSHGTGGVVPVRNPGRDADRTLAATSHSGAPGAPALRAKTAAAAPEPGAGS